MKKRRIALGAATALALGIGYGLLPTSPTPGGAAPTPTTGNLDVVVSSSSTYFDLAGSATECPNTGSDTTAGMIGVLTVSVATVPSGVTSVPVTFGDAPSQSVTLDADNQWEAQVPRSYQCQSLSSSGLPWSSSVGNGSSNKDGGTITISTFD